jgi:hypothetical protein
MSGFRPEDIDFAIISPGTLKILPPHRILLELFYGDWHETFVPSSSVRLKLFITVGLNL